MLRCCIKDSVMLKMCASSLSMSLAVRVVVCLLSSLFFVQPSAHKHKSHYDFFSTSDIFQTVYYTKSKNKMHYKNIWIRLGFEIIAIVKQKTTTEETQLIFIRLCSLTAFPESMLLHRFLCGISHYTLLFGPIFFIRFLFSLYYL